MSLISVIDASIAIKWFLADDPNRDAALEILETIRNRPKGFAVPELFFAEMLSVLCRLHSNESEVRSYFAALEQLGIQRIGQGHSLMKRAIELSIRYKLTGYDAIYASTADVSGGLWLTADAKAHRKIETLKISRLLH